MSESQRLIKLFYCSITNLEILFAVLYLIGRIFVDNRAQLALALVVYLFRCFIVFNHLNFIYPYYLVLSLVVRLWSCTMREPIHWWILLAIFFNMHSFILLPYWNDFILFWKIQVGKNLLQALLFRKVLLLKTLTDHSDQVLILPLPLPWKVLLTW